MLVVNLKTGFPIEVVDTESGTKWEMNFFYKKGGQAAIAFDAPQSIKFNYDMKSKTKGKHDGNREQ